MPGRDIDELAREFVVAEAAVVVVVEVEVEKAPKPRAGRSRSLSRSLPARVEQGRDIGEARDILITQGIHQGRQVEMAQRRNS